MYPTAWFLTPHHSVLRNASNIVAASPLPSCGQVLGHQLLWPSGIPRNAPVVEQSAVNRRLAFSRNFADVI